MEARSGRISLSQIRIAERNATAFLGRWQRVFVFTASLFITLCSFDAASQADYRGRFMGSLGDDLEKRVMAGKCPQEFVDVWQRDYQSVLRLTRGLGASLDSYEQEKSRLLAQKNWWQNWLQIPADSDEALAVTRLLTALATASDAIMDVAQMFPQGQAAGNLYKIAIVTGANSGYALGRSLEEGETAAAVWEGLNIADEVAKLSLIPGGLGAVTNLAMNIDGAIKTEGDFAEYRDALRKALAIVDEGILNTTTRMGELHQEFRFKTERGLADFCDEQPAIRAIDDTVLLDYSQQAEACIPLLVNDQIPPGLKSEVRIARIGINDPPLYPVEISADGSCVRLKMPGNIVNDFSDAFDYEIQDERGRASRARVNIQSDACDNLRAEGSLNRGSPTNLCEQLAQQPETPGETERDNIPEPSDLPQTPPLAQEGTDGYDYCPAGTINVDGECATPETAQSILKAKCDPQYGWGRCTAAEQAIARSAPTGSTNASDSPQPSQKPQCILVAPSGLEMPGAPKPQDQVYVLGEKDCVMPPWAGGPAQSMAEDTPESPEGEDILSPTQDHSGKSCRFFTRPAEEREDVMYSDGVKRPLSVSLNYYEEGATACYGQYRYQCTQGRWEVIERPMGSRPGCSLDDPRQAWRIEGTARPDGSGDLSASLDSLVDGQIASASNERSQYASDVQAAASAPPQSAQPTQLRKYQSLRKFVEGMEGLAKAAEGAGLLGSSDRTPGGGGLPAGQGGGSCPEKVQVAVGTKIEQCTAAVDAQVKGICSTLQEAQRCLNSAAAQLSPYPGCRSDADAVRQLSAAYRNRELQFGCGRR